jgi:6-phosphogluconolactonase (cycloisomerase 2 family)
MISLLITGCTNDGDGGVRTNGSGIVYTANSGPSSNSISVFRVTLPTGELEPIGSPVPAGTEPQQVVLDTTGKFAFVANTGSDDLSSYLVNPEGDLTSLGAAITVGDAPKMPTIDPLNRFLFVPNSGSDTISVFALNSSTGALTAVAGSPFLTDINPQAASLDSQGRFVWVNNLSAGTVSMYFLNAVSGFLTPTAHSPLNVGASPQSVTFQTVGLKFIAYVPNSGSGGGGVVSAFEVETTSGDVLVPVLGSPFIAGTSPNPVTIDPAGKFALVSNTGSSNVSVYTIDSSTGALSVVSGSPFPTGITPQQVTIHPNGNFAYISNTTVGTTFGSVSAFSIDQSSGVLTAMAGSPFPTGGSQPQRVTVDPTGKFAFVSNLNTDTIAVFSIDQTTGVLTPVTGSPFPTGDAPLQATIAGTF